MKKIISVLLTIVLLGLFSFPIQAQTQPKQIAVHIDGLPVTFDVPPIIQSGRTLVPFRAVSEALNSNVSWDSASRKINAKAQDKTIVLQIGNKIAFVNGTPIQLEAAPVIFKGRTLIPLRFFVENLDCTVQWNQTNYSVEIQSPIKDMTVLGFYALGDSKTSSWKGLFGVDFPQTSVGKTGFISDLALGWYSMDANGNLLTNSGTGWQRPVGWEKVLDAANSFKMNTEMVIHLPDRDSTFNQLMLNEDALNKVITSIASEAKYYQGVNLDIEGLGWKETDSELLVVKANFNRFVQLLSAQLKQSNTRLTLTLHPPNSAYKGYDYKTLGSIADRIVIMAYDYGSKPEPVSLVSQAVRMAIADVPSQKIILGISVPNETGESIKTKIGIAKRYKLNGIALWRLGLVTPEIWNSLQTTVSVVK